MARPRPRVTRALHHVGRCSALRTAAAFTLIELLVVISIIALLVAMLLPALGAVNAVARQVKCQSNLRQTAMAVIQYSDANNDWLVPGYFRDNTLGGPYPPVDTWAHILIRNDYITGPFKSGLEPGDDTVLRCPEGVNEPVDARSNPGYHHENSLRWGFAGPDYPDYQNGDEARVIDGVRVYSWYYLNAEHRHREAPFEMIFGPFQVDRWRGKRYSHIISASKFVLAFEAQNALNYPERAVARHPNFEGVHGNCNTTFFDGHVEAVYTETFDLDAVIRPIVFNLDEQ